MGQARVNDEHGLPLNSVTLAGWLLPTWLPNKYLVRWSELRLAGSWTVGQHVCQSDALSNAGFQSAGRIHPWTQTMKNHVIHPNKLFTSCCFSVQQHIMSLRQATDKHAAAVYPTGHKWLEPQSNLIKCFPKFTQLEKKCIWQAIYWRILTSSMPLAMSELYKIPDARGSRHVLLKWSKVLKVLEVL